MSLHTVAKITGVEKENEIVTTFTLDAKLETEATPGQFVMLWLPGFDEKPYSLAGVSPLTISVGARSPGGVRFRLAAVSRGVVAIMTADSTAFFNSRTLPLQGWRSRVL